MCGLIGIINKNWNKTLSVPTEIVFKQLIYAGALRGFDSTGIFKVTEKHTVEAVKKAAPAGWFLGMKEAKELIDNYYKDSIAVFAHNRKATMGLKDDATAHPFKEGPITLIHNGTLTSWDRTPTNLSDSHYITKELAKDNKEFKPLESFQGAYALIWHNAAKKQINFCRNSERPLWIIEAKEWYILVSEREMGEWILLRNGHDVLDAIEVEPDYIYKMSWKNKLHITKIKFSPAKKMTYNQGQTIFQKNGIDFDNDDFDSSGFGSFAAKEADDFPKRRDDFKQQTLGYNPNAGPTPWTPPSASNHPQTGVTQIEVVPFMAVKGDFTHGGYSPWSGFGIKEERMEVFARIHFPLSLLNQTAKWTVPIADWDETMMHERCIGTYQYKAGSDDKPVIKIDFVKKKNTTPTILSADAKSPVLLLNKPTGNTKGSEDTLLDKEIQEAIDADSQVSSTYTGEEIIVETYNNYCITDANWEDVAALKCNCCKEEFDFENAELSFVSEKIRGGEITYTYICSTCMTTFKNKSTLPKEQQGILHLNNNNSIRPVN